MTTVNQNLSDQAAEFLAASPLSAHIGGRWVQAADGATLTTYDPGTGEPIAEVPAMGAADVDLAVRAADKAFRESGWPKLPLARRCEMLHQLADAVEKHKPILAQIESLDAGKILAQAEGDIQNFVDTMRYFIDIAPMVEHRTPLTIPGHEAATVRLPWGPCGFIFPWNFPFLLIGWGIAPALVAGNTVVIKPAEDTPLSAIYLCKIAQEVGIPDGVINVVTGYGETAGAAVANHPGFKRMSFTGSPEVGRLVGEACGRNLTPCKLELGGKGAAVVFDDVDIEDTADKLMGAITFHTGQVCCDATRWLIHQSIFDELANACAKRMGAVHIGHQFDSATQMGPVVNARQRERVLGYLDKGVNDGAEFILEGGAARVEGCDGYYVKPALLTGDLDNVAAREEIFGPVAFLTPFTDEKQAVQLANATDYGLANSVWSANLARANRVAEEMVAGNSWINAHNVFPHGVPYGGINKSGMGGGVNSIETYLDYTRSLSVTRPL
ncbi:MAG: aldehyde dehydrogenase family protein [Planctomycetota bacterium]